MENKIVIALEFAKDLWNLINDAKHPHYESKIIDQVKLKLSQLISQKLRENNAVAVPLVPSVSVEDAPKADNAEKSEEIK